MKLRSRLTRKNVVIASAIVAACLAAASYFALRRAPRTAMSRYAPASTLAFLEVDNLPDLLDGLTDTRAWRELAPLFGLSSQLRQLGLGADLVSRTGLGPDEAVVAGRAQYAVALTGLEAETGASEEGPYLHFKPRFAFIVETHSSPETAARLVAERAHILAGRIYGESARREAEDHSGTEILTFSGTQPGRQLVAASAGSVILIANSGEAVRACLDAIQGRAGALADNATLRQRRKAFDEDAAIFAFLTESGIETLAQFGPAILASRFTTDPERVSSMAGLFGHLARQAAGGLLYSSRFDSGSVSEKYLTVLRPEVAEGLAEPFRPAPSVNLEVLGLVPREVEEVTVLSVASVGELPGRLLKRLAPRVDVVAALALREFVENFNEQLGLDSSGAAGAAIGDQLALVKFDDAQPLVMLIQVIDRQAVSEAVRKYLTRGQASISAEHHNGLEILISSNEDGRAAVFLGDYLELGTHDQIAMSLDAQASNKVLANEPGIRQAINSRPPDASIISYRPEAGEAAELMLALARLTRVSDGSREILEQDSLRAALDRVPPSVSFTRFLDYGIYTETRSAVGNYSLITSLIDGQDEEEKQ